MNFWRVSREFAPSYIPSEVTVLQIISYIYTSFCVETRTYRYAEGGLKVRTLASLTSITRYLQ